jgi:hypothetical protein
MANWIARCQYCGKTGGSGSSSKPDIQPTSTPQVPGKCPSHPSGKSDANHAPKWDKR